LTVRTRYVVIKRLVLALETCFGCYTSAMATYSRRFVNELGNSIVVQVSDEMRHGVKGVRIYIEGPDSDTENFVTRQEAVELLEGLSKIMKPKRPLR